MISESDKYEVPPLGLCVPCKILTVHDGDTATHATITLDIQIRYLNCWAPELTEKGGPEARDAAKAAEGKQGRLFIPLDKANNVSELFTFGRVLGEFYPDGQSESESQRLVREGFASKSRPPQKTVILDESPHRNCTCPICCPEKWNLNEKVHDEEVWG